jgi:hypothetical protein
MKKYLLFTMLVFFTIQAQSQVYRELLKEGNKWNVLLELIATCNCGRATTYSFTLSTDTLIEDINYKQLMCETISVGDYDEIVSNTAFAAALREDIANQSVYVRYPNREEQLLYDFNPQVGDTIFAYKESDQVEIIRYVTGIGEYNINGYSGKKISISDTIYWTQYNRQTDSYYTSKSETFWDEWYEGIGSLKSLIAIEDDNGYSPAMNALELLCFWNYDDMIYHHEYREECVYAFYYSDIKEISNDRKITIDSTPDKRELIINSDVDILNIQIYNPAGNKIAETARKNINISNFPNGVYLIKVQLPDNTVHTKKWVKQ